jgi:hypothetical protein
MPAENWTCLTSEENKTQNFLSEHLVFVINQKLNAFFEILGLKMMLKYFNFLLNEDIHSFEPNQLDKLSSDICQKIADFYFDKNSETTKTVDEALKASRDEIYSLGLTKIDYDKSNQCLHFHLSRPGLLIGGYGENIQNLQKYLGLEIKIFEQYKIDDVIVNRLPYLDYDE